MTEICELVQSAYGVTYDEQVVETFVASMIVSGHIPFEDRGGGLEQLLDGKWEFWGQTYPLNGALLSWGLAGVNVGPFGAQKKACGHPFYFDSQVFCTEA